MCVSLVCILLQMCIIVHSHRVSNSSQIRLLLSVSGPAISIVSRRIAGPTLMSHWLQRSFVRGLTYLRGALVFFFVSAWLCGLVFVCCATGVSLVVSV